MQHRIARRSPWYVASHIAFLACIVFQRIGIHIGDSSIALSVPVILGLTVYLFLCGEIVFDALALFIFSVFILAAMTAALASIAFPDSLASNSILSMFELLAVYAPFMMQNREAQSHNHQLSSAIIGHIFLFYMRLSAVGGIVQFGLQYVGIQAFALGRMVPALNPILLERDFNTDAIIAYGSTIRRSNGLFMLEPSLFSQFLAIAAVVEIFGRRRPLHMALYAVAYMTSYSGTGLLALALTFVIVSPSSVKNMSLLVYLSVAALFAALLSYFLLPDLFAIFAGRFNEIGAAGSSGNARFVGPLQIAQQFGWGPRSFIGYGPGAIARSVFYVPGSGNLALQLFIEYGVFGSLVFAAYILRGIWNPAFTALSIILLINLELGGALLLFTPYTLLMLFLGRWMAVARSSPGRVHAVRLNRSLPAVSPRQTTRANGL